MVIGENISAGSGSNMRKQMVNITAFRVALALCLLGAVCLAPIRRTMMRTFRPSFPRRNFSDDPGSHDALGECLSPRSIIPLEICRDREFPFGRGSRSDELPPRPFRSLTPTSPSLRLSLDLHPLQAGHHLRC